MGVREIVRRRGHEGGVRELLGHGGTSGSKRNC